MSAWVMEDGILLSYEMRILRVIIAIVVNFFGPVALCRVVCVITVSFQTV